jgi:hypothetical protein
MWYIRCPQFVFHFGSALCVTTGNIRRREICQGSCTHTLLRTRLSEHYVRRSRIRHTTAWPKRNQPPTPSDNSRRRRRRRNHVVQAHRIGRQLYPLPLPFPPIMPSTSHRFRERWVARPSSAHYLRKRLGTNSSAVSPLAAQHMYCFLPPCALRGRNTATWRRNLDGHRTSHSAHSPAKRRKSHVEYPRNRQRKLPATTVNTTVALNLPQTKIPRHS